MLIASLISYDWCGTYIDNSSCTLMWDSLPHEHFLGVILDQIWWRKLEDAIMNQYNSIEINRGNINVILSDYLESLKEIYVSD